jgi:hypothetical protein
MNDINQITNLIDDGENIASIRETPRRKRDWAAWKETCLDLMRSNPDLSRLSLGLQLTTLADDVDKLKLYYAGIGAEPRDGETQTDATEASESEDEESPQFKIFISHKTERDGDLAKHLRDKLLNLSIKQFDIFISEGIPGATDWQDWVEESVKNCNMLLFLHTTEHDDNRWLLYEAGLYRGSREEDVHLVCLKNPNLDNPPPQLARLQAYEASEEGIKEFLMDLLYRGTFTDGYKVNPELKDRDEQEFLDAVESIVEFFLEQQISVDYFRNRLNIGPIDQQLSEEEEEELILSEVSVDANDVTKQLLGLSEGPLLWKDIYEQCIDNGGVWLDELRDALDRIRNKLPFDQVLTPFDTQNGRTCFPVISRVERLQHIPTSVTVIFVERGPSDVETEHATNLVRAPQRFLTIINLLNMARRFRWNILSPYISQLSGFRASELDMAEVSAELWSSIERLETEAAAEGFTDPAHVADVFPTSYRTTIQGYFDEYGMAREKLRAAIEMQDAEKILEGLRLMLPLNKRFLLGGNTMYHSLIAGLEPIEIRDEDIFANE